MTLNYRRKFWLLLAILGLAFNMVGMVSDGFWLPIIIWAFGWVMMVYAVWRWFLCVTEDWF